MKGVDISYASLNAARIQVLKDMGIEVIGQCLWTGAGTTAELGADAGTNLMMAQDAGFVTLGYISVTSWNDGIYDVYKAYGSIPHPVWDKLVLTPIDVELEGISVKTVRNAVEETVLLGKRRCIYTAFDIWTNWMGNDLSFGDCLLWNALWDGDPDIDFPRLPYGGWTVDMVVGEQYRGGSDQPYGFDTDLDIFNEELLIGMGMTPEEIARMKALEQALNVERFAEMAAGDVRAGNIAFLKQRIAYLESLAGK